MGVIFGGISLCVCICVVIARRSRTATPTYTSNANYPAPNSGYVAQQHVYTNYNQGQMGVHSQPNYHTPTPDHVAAYMKL